MLWKLFRNILYLSNPYSAVLLVGCYGDYGGVCGGGRHLDLVAAGLLAPEQTARHLLSVVESQHSGLLDTWTRTPAG